MSTFRILAAATALAAAGTALAQPLMAPMQEGERLDEYLTAFKSRSVVEDVFAFAAGGHEHFMRPGRSPVEVYVHAAEGARRFKLFHMTDASGDPSDMSAYLSVAVGTVPFMGHRIRRFDTDWTDEAGWVRVSYITSGKVHVSDPVRIEIASSPTVFEPLGVRLGYSKGRPDFSWDASGMGDAEVFFQVIADRVGNLVSATCTNEPRFVFFDPSSVVRSLLDTDPAPELRPGAEYAFTMMALNAHNWVTTISMKPFVAPSGRIRRGPAPGDGTGR